MLMALQQNNPEQGWKWSDDPDSLGHFLVGQVGLIHKLNYLDIMCSLESNVGIW